MNEETSKALPRVVGRMARPLHPALGAARLLSRRAAGAVARSGGDHGALTLLAAGAAMGALSWLIARRRDAHGRHDG